MKTRTATLSPAVGDAAHKAAAAQGRSLNNYVNTKLAEFFGLDPSQALGFRRSTTYLPPVPVTGPQRKQKRKA